MILIIIKLKKNKHLEYKKSSMSLRIIESNKGPKSNKFLLKFIYQFQTLKYQLVLLNGWPNLLKV
jgi:hypothetical protein